MCHRKGRDIYSGGLWAQWVWWTCLKQKTLITPTQLQFSSILESSNNSTDGLKYICVYLYVCTHPCIYIFIYLYKHYICIHTIYVIYNICIMHINSNKCICVIFKIEQLYLKVVNAENWFLLLICGFNDFLGEKDVEVYNFFS